MLTVAQAAGDLFSKLGGLTYATADAQTKQDVVVALNWAMQVLQTAGQDYFTRESITMNLSAGTAAYTIPASAQAILGPLKWNTKPLRALESQSEYDQFARTYLGSAAYGVGDDGDPIAYWPRFTRNGTTGDIVNVEILLAPAPTIPAGTMVFDVVNDAVSYVVADLTSSAVLPVAQNYTESIFLPLARMAVTRSQQFSRPDLLDSLTKDGQVALQRLGFAGGFPNMEQPAPPRTTQG